MVLILAIAGVVAGLGVGFFGVGPVLAKKKATTHAAPKKGGSFLYSFAAAPGGKVKTYCSEMVLGFTSPPALPALLWTPPMEEK